MSCFVMFLTAFMLMVVFYVWSYVLNVRPEILLSEVIPMNCAYEQWKLGACYAWWPRKSNQMLRSFDEETICIYKYWSWLLFVIVTRQPLLYRFCCGPEPPSSVCTTGSAPLRSLWCTPEQPHCGWAIACVRAWATRLHVGPRGGYDKPGRLDVWKGTVVMV